MAEIILPTKVTQDAIKAKTDLIGSANPTAASTANVLGYLKKLDDKPAPAGGTNFADFYPYFKQETFSQASVTNQPRRLLYSLSGEFYAEYLGLTTSYGHTNSNLTIEVDGMVIADGTKTAPLGYGGNISFVYSTLYNVSDIAISRTRIPLIESTDSSGNLELSVARKTPLFFRDLKIYTQGTYSAGHIYMTISGGAKR